MAVPDPAYGDDEDWGDDDYAAEPAPTLPKRRKKRGKSKKKTMSAKPGVGKRILASIGMVFGLILILGGTFAIISGNMRGARGIGCGVVMFAVSLGWFRGTSG